MTPITAPFQLRTVRTEDLEDLYQLGQLVTFINLPADRDQISKLIKKSLQSFERPSGQMEQNYYLFVLEDLKSQRVIGCSLIHAQHGTAKEPHFFLRLGQEHKFSQSLNTGFVHGTLKLGVDTNGPTEIGALVLHPDYRANPQRLGKQLSFVRFLYMALYPERFKPTIHVELMPPLDQNGDSPLWEAIGRRFLNMDYQEADKLSRQNKEFILSLFPSENIYTTLLTPEVRSVIGEVGPDTLPVRKMLEDIGFTYTQEVDPFDGGPHYRAQREEIYPIKHQCRGMLMGMGHQYQERCREQGIEALSTEEMSKQAKNYLVTPDPADSGNGAGVKFSCCQMKLTKDERLNPPALISLQLEGSATCVIAIPLNVH
jgi:arginine N-succinyltransferase